MLKNFKNEKKNFEKSCPFITIPFESLQLLKQLMTKSKTRFAFKPLGND